MSRILVAAALVAGLTASPTVVAVTEEPFITAPARDSRAIWCDLLGLC